MEAEDDPPDDGVCAAVFVEMLAHRDCRPRILDVGDSTEIFTWKDRAPGNARRTEPSPAWSSSPAVPRPAGGTAFDPPLRLLPPRKLAFGDGRFVPCQRKRFCSAENQSAARVELIRRLEHGLRGERGPCPVAGEETRPRLRRACHVALDL